MDTPATEAAAPRAGRRQRQPREQAPPTFIDAVDLARELGVCTKTLRKWVAEGIVPRPRCLGERVRLWRRDHWEAYVATGEWPEAAWK